MTVISQVGTDVTVREITRGFDDYGDATETNSDSTITCLIIPASCDDVEMKARLLKQYQYRGFFKATDSSKIKDGNEILYDGHWCVIQNVEPIYMSSSILHIEAELVYLVT